MSSREEYIKAIRLLDKWHEKTGEPMRVVEAYVASLERERDELKKQLEGALAMYDIRLRKYDELVAKDRGLVAEALKRQGIDPATVKSNTAELNAISGKRFESDLDEEGFVGE